MKTQWTKLLVVLLTLAMVLSIVACGEKTPNDGTTGSTPADTNASTPADTNASTPADTNASTPESTPESTPADTDPNGKPGESTPAEPTVTRPTEPTIESYTTDGEEANWVFEINKATTAITVDGVLEEAAYYTGVYLVAEINMPDSDSTFVVFATADDTHIYFFYEFTKVEDIFWDETYEASYHLDCVDFCLNLAGLKAIGTEFHIMAGVEGDMNTSKPGYGKPANAGVDNWFVKYTDKGYNVEFSIPLESVTGTDENGDKKISFTALSTITTAWDDKTAAPTRYYTAACCAAGALKKDSPSYLVVKGTKVEGEKTYPKTDDGRYLVTFTASKESLANADIKANAGVSFEAKFGDGNKDLMNEQNTYTVYLAADAENVYVFFEIKDSNIVSVADDKAYNKLTDGSQWWWNDCAEIDFNVDGSTNLPYQIRVWGETAGTNHYDNEAAENAAIKTGMADGVLKSYTVTHAADGYNVLYVLDRTKMTEDTFAMYFSVALGDIVKPATDTELAEYGRIYGAIDSVAKAAGNAAKPFANVFKIVDAE